MKVAIPAMTSMAGRIREPVPARPVSAPAGTRCDFTHRLIAYLHACDGAVPGKRGMGCLGRVVPHCPVNDKEATKAAWVHAARLRPPSRDFLLVTSGLLADSMVRFCLTHRIRPAKLTRDHQMAQVAIGRRHPMYRPEAGMPIVGAAGAVP